MHVRMNGFAYATLITMRVRLLRFPCLYICMYVSGSIFAQNANNND